MSDCCSSNTSATEPSAKTALEKASSCPVCGEKGKPVKSITLHSLLKRETLSRIDDSPYHFCSSQACDVVYFGGNGATPFTKGDLTVRVGIKETATPRHVCYCFNHTIEEIEEEVRRTGKTTVLDDIKTRMKTACWCETKSPQGSCCLATVTKYVKAALVEHGRRTTAVPSQDRVVEDCCASPAHRDAATTFRGCAGSDDKVCTVIN